MDNKEKVFYPEETIDAPFPGGDLPIAITQAQTPGTFSPTVSKEKAFPKKRTAVELLSTALNTRSKKILQSFEFTPSGAIQIGKFENGISGDLRLTPNGLTARDIAGITTFAIDGITGDAIFKGEIKSGSLVTGTVVVGNNSVIIDGSTKTIIVNDGTNDRVLIGFDEGGF